MAIEVPHVSFLRGHLVPGFLLFTLGLWHLFNTIKLHAINPKSYTSFPWFPTSRIRYIELYLLIFFLSLVIFSAPFFLSLPSDAHSSKQLIPDIEHIIIALNFFVYGVFAILLDKLNPPAAYDLTNLVLALGFGQELLVFHLHSTSRVGFDAQYHWLYQVLISVTFVTALLAIKHPKSFVNGFVRSVSLVCRGIWLIVMGFMLFIPSLIPEGCYLYSDGGHWTVGCHEEDALHRAKSLVNIQFSTCVVGIVTFSLIFYLMMIKLYSKKNLEYQVCLTKFEEEDKGQSIDHDVEALEEKI